MRLGDLDALKEVIKNSFKHNLHGYDALLISEIEEFIDNAPTVEPFEPDYVGAERLKARQRGYEEGYHNGMAIGKTLNPKIKQGKWIIKPKENSQSAILICNKCNHFIPITIDKNFCPNCGARMKGGAE